jgi:hypothetical protein
MSNPEVYKTFSRTRHEYDSMRVKREQTVGRGAIYTAMILLENCVVDAWALPAEIKDLRNGVGAGVVQLLLKRPYDFLQVAAHPGSLDSGIWTPEPHLQFIEDDKSLFDAVEVYFLPYDDGLDLNLLDVSELIGAGH